jgi:hypothetical protein
MARLPWLGNHTTAFPALLAHQAQRTRGFQAGDYGKNQDPVVAVYQILLVPAQHRQSDLVGL